MMAQLEPLDCRQLSQDLIPRTLTVYAQINYTVYTEISYTVYIEINYTEITVMYVPVYSV